LEFFMPTIIKKTDARKTVRNTGDAMTKAGSDTTTSGNKTAHDASQAGGETVRNVMEATRDEATRKNAEAAEQSLQKVVDDLRGTVEHSAARLSDAVGTSREISERTDEQLGQMTELRDKASKELASRTQQNLAVMIQTGTRLADGFQAIMREWADYTRNAMQCNIDGMNSIMRARTPQDLMAAQRELLNAEVRIMLTSGVRISEATIRVAKDAVQSIGERTK
jgi:hypothetical protein